MTADRALLDSGALVALLHRDDQDHQRCRRELEVFRGTLFATEPVLTDATHLLSKLIGGPSRCLEFFLRGGAVLVPQTLGSLSRCKALIEQYSDTPMDLADATLVSLAEEAGLDLIFTLDRRGFETYRVHGRKRFRIRPAPPSP